MAAPPGGPRVRPGGRRLRAGPARLSCGGRALAGPRAGAPARSGGRRPRQRHRPADPAALGVRRGRRRRGADARDAADLLGSAAARGRASGGRRGDPAAERLRRRRHRWAGVPLVPAPPGPTRDRAGPAPRRAPRACLEPSRRPLPALPAAHPPCRSVRRADPARGGPRLAACVRRAALGVRPAPHPVVPVRPARPRGDDRCEGAVDQLRRLAPSPGTERGRSAGAEDRGRGGSRPPGGHDRPAVPDRRLLGGPARPVQRAADASHVGDQTHPPHFAGLGSARPSYGPVARRRSSRIAVRADASHGTTTSRSR